jgi:hypothetical protein
VVLFSGLFGILLEINNSHEKRLNTPHGLRAVKDLGREQSERALAHNHIDGLGDLDRIFDDICKVIDSI